MGNLTSKEQWGLQRRMLVGAGAGLMLGAIFKDSASAASEYGVLDSDIGEVVFVESGDTLWDIAKKHNTNVGTIVKANPAITNPDLIHPGEAFLIPYDQKTGGEREQSLQSITMPYERRPVKSPFLTAFDAVRKPYIVSGIWGGVVPGGEARLRIYMRDLTTDLPGPGEINMQGRGTYYPLETTNYEVIGKGNKPHSTGQIASIEVGPTTIPVIDNAEVTTVDLKVQPTDAPRQFNLKEGQELVRKALADNRTLLFSIDKTKQAKSVRIVTV